MEDINVKIHQQLKEYAQRLFAATVDAYTKDGKCSLKPGKYSAKEMQRENFMKIHEVNTGHALTPEEIDEEITVTAGEFSASFMYRDIFVILARWEAMMKPGKNKSVFEIGNVEIISAKVLTDEKNELGAYKGKRMKLQRLYGNWYAPAKINKNAYNVDIYYKSDAVTFCGGQMPANSLVETNRNNLIKRLDEVEKDLTGSLSRLAERNEYFAEVCKRMNVAEQPATPAETPRISTETTEEANISTEEDKREEIVANCLYWDYQAQAVKERVNKLTKVTEHLYYIDGGGEFVIIARCLNGVFWEQQGNAEIHRSAFDPSGTKYETILNGLCAYQTAEEFIAKEYTYRMENGWYVGKFTSEIVRRLTPSPEPVGSSDNSPNPPQISTETAEAANVSAEGENAQIKHISEIVATCRLHDEAGEQTDEWRYYQWLASVNHGNYQTIAESALIEAWYNIFCATMKKGKGHVLAMNSRGELVDTVFGSSTPEPIEKLEQLPQPPKFALQSGKIAPAANYVTPTPRRAQRANMRSNSAAWRFRTTRRIVLLTSANCYPANPPPIGSPPRTLSTGSN